MMKKILRMLLLGFLTVTVLSPSVVTAEEDQTGQVPSSSVYSEIDGIAPMATPFIHEVTLVHGESYELTRDIIFTPLGSNDLGTPYILWRIATVSGEKETFSVTELSNVPGIDWSYTNYYHSNTYELPSQLRIYKPDETDVRYFGFRLTNYSSGLVTFRLGMNVTYGTLDGLDFDLF